ncbi:RDD family protein [Sporichthya brevicatena]|uniref:RDD family protein n=1 Tax=Sporichthya brevicatena TaxID=171442 RepID=A0ABP3RBF5_9ACTN
MVDRRALGGWLSGPRSVAEAAGIDLGYPGERLGLPEEGPNAVGGMTRRLGATFIDWTIAQFVVLGAMPGSTAGERAAPILIVFALINLAMVTTIGAGIGGRLLGLRVARLDGGNPMLPAVAIRTLMLALVVPALFIDRDYRGVHDRLARSIVVRR